MWLVKVITALNIVQAIYVRSSGTNYPYFFNDEAIMCLIGVIAALAALPIIFLVKLLRSDNMGEKLIGFAMLFVIIAGVCFTCYGTWEGWWTDKEGLQFWTGLLCVPYVLVITALVNSS